MNLVHSYFLAQDENRLGFIDVSLAESFYIPMASFEPIIQLSENGLKPRLTADQEPISAVALTSIIFSSCSIYLLNASCLIYHVRVVITSNQTRVDKISRLREEFK